MFGRTIGCTGGDRGEDKGGGAAVPLRQRSWRHGGRGTQPGGASSWVASRVGTRRRPTRAAWRAARACHARTARIRFRTTNAPNATHTPRRAKLVARHATDINCANGHEDRSYGSMPTRRLSRSDGRRKTSGWKLFRFAALVTPARWWEHLY